MGYGHRRHLLGVAGSCHGGGAGAPYAHVLEGSAISTASRVHAGRERGVLVHLAADRQPVVDPHQRVRPRIGQGLYQDSVHHAEERGIGADPERQREHDRQNESGLGANQAPGLTCGAQRAFGERERVHPVDLLADQRHVAQLSPRRGACRLKSHAAFDVLLGRHLHVERQLLLLFGVSGPPSEEAFPVHPLCSVAGFMMRAMACTNWSQRDD